MSLDRASEVELREEHAGAFQFGHDFDELEEAASRSWTRRPREQVVVKNKCAHPFTEAEFDIRWGIASTKRRISSTSPKRAA